MNRRIVITALGIAQILSWGCSYYLPAVLARPIATDTGWPFTWVVAGLSAGLLCSGLASAFTGSLIQRNGGRPVLIAGAILLASGLVVMGLAPNLPVYFLAWMLMGVGMSASLYDAGFGTLGRLYGKDARGAITSLTLFGGFASTVCWPLSAFLVEHFGWRATCFTYAGIQLVVSLPAFLMLVPAAPGIAGSGIAGPPPSAGSSVHRPTFVLLACITALAAMIASMLSVHLLTVLQLRGIDLAVAVGLGTLIGPSQVGARVVEMVIGKYHHPLWTMLASVLLLAAGTGLLLTGWPVTALALILYGAGNGVHTIARGALPLVLFDPYRYASIMGRLAVPSLIMQALAPSVGALLLDHGGSSTMLGVLFAAALTALLLVLCLAQVRSRVGTSR
ncbi:MFS transporter [Ollibium composti]|uniref:MFS transporter n=1 Tax=Ollibium composti TaxID=2675109 RepID=A0ABY2Q4L4_9HYPH|nr:MFS transporter [Mesorhizobium composti]THF55242.1 MFS transporter [Mesorhizobium composti]